MLVCFLESSDSGALEPAPLGALDLSFRCVGRLAHVLSARWFSPHKLMVLLPDVPKAGWALWKPLLFDCAGMFVEHSAGQSAWVKVAACKSLQRLP